MTFSILGKKSREDREKKQSEDRQKGSKTKRCKRCSAPMLSAQRFCRCGVGPQ